MEMNTLLENCDLYMYISEIHNLDTVTSDTRLLNFNVDSTWL